MKTKYTRVWEIDGTLVVAPSIEEAIALYKKSYEYDHDCSCIDIYSVEIVKARGGSLMAVASVDEDKEEDLV